MLPEQRLRQSFSKTHHAGPTGLRLINFLKPPFFCSGALDSGENEGGIWLISVLDPDPPPYELNPPLELLVGSDCGGGENCGIWFGGGPGVVCCCGGKWLRGSADVCCCGGRWFGRGGPGTNCCGIGSCKAGCEWTGDSGGGTSCE
jgi:hypothetical protein